MKIGLVAGEASGDRLGAGLIQALRERSPDAVFEGVAGPHMIDAGCSCWHDAESLAVMGLIEPLKEIPRLLRLRRSLARRWIAEPPDVFVGIDAPDFNLGLEKRLKRAGIPTVHYVSPTLWAWRPGRIHKIKKAADRVLCLLPFEPEYYRQHDVRAVFVGHPQADSAPEHVDTENARRALGFRNDGLVIAMLPGSRVSEVSRLGALFAESAKLIADDVSDVRFVTPVATPALRPLIDTQLADAGVNRLFTLIDGQSETAMASADVVLLASGTAALESALLCKPTVAAYRVHALTALFLRAFRLLKIDRFTLPNLLTKTPQIPEFIQEDASPQALSSAVLALLRDSDRRAAIALRFAKLRTELALGANQRAAETVASLANHAATTTISN